MASEKVDFSRKRVREKWPDWYQFREVRLPDGWRKSTKKWSSRRPGQWSSQVATMWEEVRVRADPTKAESLGSGERLQASSRGFATNTHYPFHSEKGTYEDGPCEPKLCIAVTP